MKLSNEVKQLIEKEYEDFKAKMYAGKSPEEREELGQFFTPAGATIQMLEMLPDDALKGNILDPTSGSGNLLAAALIAGADSDKVFGNEYETIMVELCRERLNNVCDLLGKPHIQNWQIHKGDATESFCLNNFGPNYKEQLISYWYAVIPLADILDPDHKQLDAWLSKAQIEFLKEVD